ncbi:HepT-like ribonuclease domain-containing protein [Dissulfurispira sp.]|uniref:HepT-like ribonuclease domain-containing protein n=1 Tax=Dissulfurispira sp. TaxID=2817609 RepID=UPI002FDAD207
MTRDFSLFIKDILEAIDDIENFIGDMSFEAFSSDRKTRTAVVHEVEIIGEAAKKHSHIHQK